MRRLHSAKAGAQHSSRRICITNALKEDLELWLQFLITYNKRTLFSFVLRPKFSSCSLGSDASKGGFGGFWGQQCIAGRFPSSWQVLSIEALELYPILALVGTFAEDMRDSQILVQCDNQPLVHCLNKLSSRNPEVMSFMRPLVLFLLSYNISLWVEYISSADNWLCDTLSRRQVTPHWLLAQGKEDKLKSIRPSLRPEALRSVLAR